MARRAGCRSRIHGEQSGLGPGAASHSSRCADSRFTAALDAAGPWEISGEFSLALNAATRKVELTGTLSMVRANTEPRSSHTHHLRMVDGEPSAIDNGVRIVGTAAITTNGSLAGFTGAPVVIELTGGSALVFSNFKITFGVPAAGHFGPDPIDGVVSLRR